MRGGREFIEHHFGHLRTQTQKAVSWSPSGNSHHDVDFDLELKVNPEGFVVQLYLSELRRLA